MWHCTDESLRAAGSKPGEQRWGPPEARRYHHYWRGHDGRWYHRELPAAVGTRPKIFLDRQDNAYVIFSTEHRPTQSADGLLHSTANLAIAAATSASKWLDWRIVHVEEGPFINEMVGDPYRWKQEQALSVMVQESPGQPHQATPLRILDFSVGTSAPSNEG
jgi:hypothetical protein